MADLDAATEAVALARIREFLGYLPSCAGEPPPRRSPTDDTERRDPELLHVVPDSPRRAYDMRKVIRMVVDEGDMFELKPDFARSAITTLARMDGRSVGIVANQPMVAAGTIDSAASFKISRFVSFCDAFDLPLVFLVDVPGFMPGRAEELKGIIRHSAKLIYDLAVATVPKVTVILRKAYGLGYYAMGGRGMAPDLIVAWPSAEISAMGPEGGVHVVHRKKIEAAEDSEGLRRQLVEEFRRDIGPRLAAEEHFIDDIIDPRDTRPLIIRTLEMARPKRPPRLPKKHGIVPI
jgi:acetyl-CoA carboxylase carboxyltransferase component